MRTGQRDQTYSPLSWADSGRSVLSLNIRHLWLFGLWPLHDFWPFYLYTACGLLLGFWNVVEGALAAYFSWGDMDDTTLALLTAITQGCGALKMVVFLYTRRHFSALVRRLDALVSLQSEVCGGGSVPAAILRASRRRAKRTTLGTLLFMLSQCFVWYPIPLVAHAEERRLPFAQHPWDGNRHHYALSYFAQCAAGLLMTQISFGVDCLFASAMILVAAQLQILTVRLKEMAVVSRTLCKGKTAYFEEDLLTRSTDQMYNSLRICIEDHQKILRFVTHLQNTMSPMAIMQFGASVLVICFALFQATYSKDFSSALKCTSFLPVPCTQVYLYCWAANEVTIQAEAVSLAAYSSSWVETSPRFKLSLRILISRAQKPLILTAGHLYRIDKEAFLSLVNASYSYYALLSQTTNK
ncbi:odorant receptor Or2-like [Schistocerca cancellata]|uniref:odorant receptor Or2-like n=1 Tax=Schistocerca cancellata TaxID=274614 RepID=UPI002117694B|nr:odorant receptor Or2-like [Schistocerca cancellata]